MDFSEIKYDDTLHSYAHSGVPLIAVTKVVSALKYPFDLHGSILRRCADRDGKSTEEMQAEWNLKGEIGRVRGNEVHYYVECVVNNVSDPLHSLNQRRPEMVAFDAFWVAFQKFKPKLYKVEWVVGDVDLGVAGRIDMVFEITVDGEVMYVIFDWKTGKFETSSIYGCLKLPFDTLDECQLNLYSLQISLYHLILDRNTDLNLKHGYLVHLKDDGSYQLYMARDYRSGLEKWLGRKVPAIHEIVESLSDSGDEGD